MPWKADSILAAAFPMPGLVQPDALKAWRMLFGDDSPDGFQRPAGVPNAVSIASGIREGLQAQLTSQLGRLEMQVTAPPGSVNETPIHIGDVEAAIHEMIRCLVIFGSAGPLYRIAIVANMSDAIGDLGLVKQLSEVTGGIDFPLSSVDCLYQFNIRRTFSSDPSIQMNRTCTWAAAERQLLSFMVGMPSEVNASTPFKISVTPMLSLKIDVNSATGFGTPIGQNLGELASEIGHEVISIIANGRRALEG